ncbi:DNA-3-methyladenine glycosylase I [Bifidobacterium mongoliense]|uniref:DNA-3-methyladenine glycosylase I n=1 Tax=Bifidobacterium mongoliense TaxID=518643 RepID=UPI0030EC41A7
MHQMISTAVSPQATPLSETPPVALPRCSWGETDDPLMRAYHDDEWGTACHDDRALFELLSLEIMQAGLSWRTVLHKRAAFRAAFHDFDYHRVAAMADDMDGVMDGLLANAAIIRNRRKLEAVMANAGAAVALEKDGRTLSAYLWSFVDGTPIEHDIVRHEDVPCSTELSRTMATTMRRDGFRFTGPVVVYSLLQASGMVNDHERGCFLAPEGAERTEPIQ